jgi:hypothetical protein
MRNAAAAIMVLLLWPASASAMNWEGHDDWMLSFSPGYTLEAFAPDAKPLPSPDCPVTPEAAVKNPYEQIPLPRHKCKPAGGDGKPAALTPR